MFNLSQQQMRLKVDRGAGELVDIGFGDGDGVAFGTPGTGNDERRAMREHQPGNNFALNDAIKRAPIAF